MDTNKNTSTVKKISFFQKILSFTRNDADYQPEKKEPIHINTWRLQPRSWWRNIKAALFVLVAFYVLLCAFILLNPQFALFFNNVFYIEYVTIQRVLEYTIYIFYSIFGIVIWTAFLFFWYRAIVIKTHKKYKRILLWFCTLLFWGLFFGNMILFGVTYNWFLSIDFSNLEERVIIYDNTLLGYKRNLEEKMPFYKIPKKWIWPLSVRFDISPQIKKIVRENGLLLNRGYTFFIDYNKDGEPDTGSGDNAKVELPITNLESPVLVPGEYTEAGQYKTVAKLIAIDAAGNKKEVDIEMPTVLIQNIVKVSYKDQKDGSKNYIFDALSFSNIWQARWSILDSPGTEYSGYQFSPKDITKYPAIICLKMQPMDIGTTDVCDWRYVIGDNIQTNITNTNIQVKTDPLDPLKYQFILDPKIGQGQVSAIRWRIDGKLYNWNFVSGTEKIFDYTFKKSGTYFVSAEIEDTLGNRANTATEPIFTLLLTTLKMGYTLQVLDESGLDITHDAYDDDLKTYLLPDMAIPAVLNFDATGIQSTNPRLRLVQAEWDMDGDGIYEKTWFKISQNLPLPGQYTYNARYIFEDTTIDGEIQKQMYRDKIIVRWVQKSLDVRVKILPDHDYAPALVHFDATGSKTQKGEIIKFLYEFWDGKKHEGESSIDYRYTVPGEYKVRVTAVTNTGEKATKEYILIIKKPQELVKIEPSISSENAQVNVPITFEAIIQWNVKTIIWDFGDNTGSSEWESVVHSFGKTGNYRITARAFYESGIEKTDTIIYLIR